MKVRLMAALLSVCLLAPAGATSLKLSPDIDLLVIDGKKMSGAILKGAESLEVDDGLHQILFQVSKTLHPATMNPLIYHSPAMIVTFNAEGLKSVSFTLPTLNNEMDTELFSKKLNYRLVDENGRDIIARRDVLKPLAFGSSSDLEKLMIAYNLSGLKASVPDFAIAAQKGRTRIGGTSLSMLTPANKNTAHTLPTFWSQLAASPHLGRFLSWLNIPQP